MPKFTSLKININCWNVQLFITHSIETLSEIWFQHSKSFLCFVSCFNSLSLIMINILLFDAILCYAHYVENSHKVAEV